MDMDVGGLAVLRREVKKTVMKAVEDNAITKIKDLANKI